MQIFAKIHQKYANLCKNKPFVAYKPLVLLKKRSRLTFEPMKVCSKWVCLKGPEQILSVFKQFGEGLDDF